MHTNDHDGCGLRLRGYGGDGGPATAARLSSPNGVAVDGDSNLLVVDHDNQRVRTAAAGAPRIITTYAGNGGQGYGGDGGAATSALLFDPTGVVMHGVDVYIADFNGARIRRVDGGTRVITTVAGSGARGRAGDGGPGTLAQLFGPLALTVDPGGNIFVAELNNRVVRALDAATGVISTIAGSGVSGFSGDGGPGTLAALTGPGGIAVSQQAIYISDKGSHRVRAMPINGGAPTTPPGRSRTPCGASPTGTTTTTCSMTTTGTATRSGAATAPGTTSPTGAATMPGTATPTGTGAHSYATTPTTLSPSTVTRAATLTASPTSSATDGGGAVAFAAAAASGGVSPAALGGGIVAGALVFATLVIVGLFLVRRQWPRRGAVLRASPSLQVAADGGDGSPGPVTPACAVSRPSYDLSTVKVLGAATCASPLGSAPAEGVAAMPTTAIAPTSTSECVAGAIGGAALLNCRDGDRESNSERLRSARGTAAAMLPPPPPPPPSMPLPPPPPPGAAASLPPAFHVHPAEVAAHVDAVNAVVVHRNPLTVARLSRSPRASGTGTRTSPRQATASVPLAGVASESLAYRYFGSQRIAIKR